MVSGKCKRCGYNTVQIGIETSYLTPICTAIPTMGVRGYILSQGDSLQGERYRLITRMPLPEGQKLQGAAWSALDLQQSHRHVLIREIIVPQELARTSSRDRVAYAVAHRLTALGQKKGFSRVIDFFRDRQSYFLVFLYPDGESLLSLIRRQGGALPEDLVADYGAQVCSLLTMLADQQTPIVHGAISPETIIISADRRSVSLIHLPLFPPDPWSSDSSKPSSEYYAPEHMREKAEFSSDLYGLAASMYHAVTGYDPYTPLALFYPPVRHFNSTVTSSMEMILARQLSNSVSQRYAHPADMQKDLLALLDGSAKSFSFKRSGSSAGPLLLSSSKVDEHLHEGIVLTFAILAGIVLLIAVLILAVLRS